MSYENLHVTSVTAQNPQRDGSCRTAHSQPEAGFQESPRVDVS